MVWERTVEYGIVFERMVEYESVLLSLTPFWVILGMNLVHTPFWGAYFELIYHTFVSLYHTFELL